MKIEQTIIIPHYRYPNVNKCIETLYKYTPPNFRLIVIDQNPNSKIDSSRVHLHIKAYRPLGFTKACNIGWRLSDTKYTTLLNDDVEFIDSRWWQGVIDSFSEPQIVAVNPKSARDYAIGGKVVNNVPYNSSYDKMLELPYKSMQCRAMFCTVFRTDLAKRVGYFDEYFNMGGEDTDWILRAKMLRESQNKFRGYDVISTPLSYVWHWWQQSNTDPTFIKARILLKEKWGWDFDFFKATSSVVKQPKILIKII
jgi:GT2 family glycosyltransferase